MEKVFAYLRVSDPSQIKGDGFPRQLKAVTDYARANKLEIVNTFRELGVSGTKEHRPVLAELMVSMEQNGHGVKTVIIEKLDRLARDLMIQEAIIGDFNKHGFKLISVAEGTDLGSSDPTRKLLRVFMGGIAEYEKVMMVAKLRAARERIKLKTGKCEGNKGYRDTPEGQAILSRINTLRRKPRTGRRLTWQQIADQLNAEGILTIDGHPWSLHRVQQTALPTQHKKI
ncbi:MAG TPA: recombinase family protein [Prolixibacteraceae bacterium]